MEVNPRRGRTSPATATATATMHNITAQHQQQRLTAAAAAKAAAAATTEQQQQQQKPLTNNTTAATTNGASTLGHNLIKINSVDKIIGKTQAATQAINKAEPSPKF